MSCERCGKPHNAGTRLTHELMANGTHVVFFRVCRSERKCDERMAERLGTVGDRIQAVASEDVASKDSEGRV